MRCKRSRCQSNHQLDGCAACSTIPTTCRGYVIAARRQAPDRLLTIAAEEDGHRVLVSYRVLPVLLKVASGRAQLFDATCPVGYSGPLVRPQTGTDLDDFVDRAIKALAAILRRNDTVAASVRFPAVASSPTCRSIRGD